MCHADGGNLCCSTEGRNCKAGRHSGADNIILKRTFEKDTKRRTKMTGIICNVLAVALGGLAGEKGWSL